jgi:ABC-type multidrug transport system ATPase subunit
MKLTLSKKYKSLDPLTIDLPSLTILTGVNGAGKTQLLTSIIENQLQLTENGTELNPKKYVTHSTLSPNDSTVVTRQSVNQNIENIWNQYNSFIQNYKQNPAHQLQHFLGEPRQIRLIEKIAKEAGKDKNSLSGNDFYKYYPLEDGLNHTDVFYQNFSNLFKRYNDRLLENKFNKFLKEQEKQNEIEYLSDEQFISLNGEAPWDFVNKIIKEAKLDYQINSPISLHQDAPFELKLINTFNSSEVKFSDLSSGEKVLMSLALALYNSKFDIEFPKVLLMDEPDASLHPTMSKQFLQVVQKVFVEEKGVRVIITTHSPSTVALANEENLFVVNKTGVRIEKTTKDKALKILTSGVPSFSVNYENRRQVFVESPNDVLFYEKIYQKLAHLLIPEISLSFISSGESRTDKNGTKISNCDQVINITNILRKGGNNFIWGIIDWDTTSVSSDFVKVLGNGNRYAIENYLFDPILVSALLLREKIITREDIGLINNETYADFKNLNFSQLQVIANYITDKVSLNANPADKTTFKTQLLNGIEVEIPIWYLHHNGHTLEDALIKTFPGLGALKRGKEEALKLEIINKVIDDIPELISIDLLDIFKNVQTV